MADSLTVGRISYGPPVTGQPPLLPSKPLTVGVVSLPSLSVPVLVTAQTQAMLDQVLAQIPADKRGQARLVIDLKGIDAAIGTHLSEHVDVAAGAGKTWQGQSYAGAEIRIVW